MAKERDADLMAQMLSALAFPLPLAFIPFQSCLHAVCTHNFSNLSE
jgi:hypothetical protein